MFALEKKKNGWMERDGGELWNSNPSILIGFSLYFDFFCRITAAVAVVCRQQPAHKMLNSSINSNGIPGIIQYCAIYLVVAVTIASKHTTTHISLSSIKKIVSSFENYSQDVKLLLLLYFFENLDIDFDVSMSSIASRYQHLCSSWWSHLVNDISCAAESKKKRKVVNREVIISSVAVCCGVLDIL